MDTLPATVFDYLNTLIQEWSPSTILLVCDNETTATRLSKSFSGRTTKVFAYDATSRPPPVGSKRFDLAIVIDTLGHLPAEAGERLLGQLRDTQAAAVVAITGPSERGRAAWTISDFIALGFRRSRDSRDLAPGWAIYRYDIHDYKTTPGWLNSRYWANPHRWGKNRW